MSSPSCFCHHCQVSVPRPRTAGWRVLYTISWGAFLVAPLLWFGPLALFAVAVLPLGVLLMGGLIAPLRERAMAEPRCSRCHRYTLPAGAPAVMPRVMPVAFVAAAVAAASPHAA